ncbi:hypothetical protein Tcan_07371 [Toxocara canis]|uniref:Uncharacterized protein n=1 Tax=Toxocara canis TaxID=6265 RepID=A0A0B2UTY4_TOXCA|nr:hypothetical protein Tcan_07371 [Toxocara canis]
MEFSLRKAAKFFGRRDQHEQADEVSTPCTHCPECSGSENFLGFVEKQHRIPVRERLPVPKLQFLLLGLSVNLWPGVFRNRSRTTENEKSRSPDYRWSKVSLQIGAGAS